MTESPEEAAQRLGLRLLSPGPEPDRAPNGGAESEQQEPNGHAPEDSMPDLVLDPADAMSTARALKDANFLLDGHPTLHRHRGAFWLWTGSCYRLAGEEWIKSAIWNFLDGCSKLGPTGKDGVAKLIPFKPTKTQVSNVYEALIAVCLLDDKIESPAWLAGPKRPPASEFFACRTGLLHLPAGKSFAAMPTFFGLYASEVVFATTAPPPSKWLAFLKELFEDDVQSVQLLQEWFGYLLSSDATQQKILLLVGPKRSGKGTIARVLTELLGHDSVAGPTMSSLGDTFGLEPLITASAAIISDARVGSHKTELTERLLSISGEDTMTVARKYLRAWTGRLPTRLGILTNELPALTDGSGALASRFLVMLFTKSFYDNEDPTLTRKLIAESSGILNWAIEGYRRLNQRGHFIQPKSAIEARDEIEMLAAPVKAFIRDCCEVAKGRLVTVEGLWIEYKYWCERQGLNSANKAWFGRNLQSAAPGVKRKQAGSQEDRATTYEGIGFQKKPAT